MKLIKSFSQFIFEQLELEPSAIIIGSYGSNWNPTMRGKLVQRGTSYEFEFSMIDKESFDGMFGTAGIFGKIEKSVVWKPNSINFTGDKTVIDQLYKLFKDCYNTEIPVRFKLGGIYVDLDISKQTIIKLLRITVSLDKKQYTLLTLGKIESLFGKTKSDNTQLLPVDLSKDIRTQSDQYESIIYETENSVELPKSNLAKNTELSIDTDPTIINAAIGLLSGKSTVPINDPLNQVSHLYKMAITYLINLRNKTPLTTDTAGITDEIIDIAKNAVLDIGLKKSSSQSNELAAVSSFSNIGSNYKAAKLIDSGNDIPGLDSSYKYSVNIT